MGLTALAVVGGKAAGGVKGGWLNYGINISFKPSFLETEKFGSAICKLIAKLFKFFFSLCTIDVKREATKGREVTEPGAVLYLAMVICQGDRAVLVGDGWYKDHGQRKKGQLNSSTDA
eukprot:11428712-Ditylum_brightwellii.AAC.1